MAAATIKSSSTVAISQNTAGPCPRRPSPWQVSQQRGEHQQEAGQDHPIDRRHAIQERPSRSNGHAGQIVTTPARGIAFDNLETFLELTAALAHHAGSRVIGGTVRGVVIQHLIASFQQLPEVLCFCVSHVPTTISERISLRLWHAKGACLGPFRVVLLCVA
jgi:hypothetical protein